MDVKIPNKILLIRAKHTSKKLNMKIENIFKLRFNAHEKHTELILCLKVVGFTCTQVMESKFEIRLKTHDEL